MYRTAQNDEFDEILQILPLKFSSQQLFPCKADTIHQNFTRQFFLTPNLSKFCAIRYLEKARSCVHAICHKSVATYL